MMDIVNVSKESIRGKIFKIFSENSEGAWVIWCLTRLATIFQLYRGGSVLLMKETGVPGENHRPAASH